MHSPEPSDPTGSSERLIEIVDALEAHGLPRDSYQLYDSVDVDALERLFASCDSDTEVQFTVDDIRLTVTQNDIDVQFDRHVGSRNQ